MKQNLDRQKKHENNSNESDFREIPDLNSSEAVVRKCSVKSFS